MSITAESQPVVPYIANPYEPINRFTNPDGRGLNREELVNELALFTEANFALTAICDQLAAQLLEACEDPESLDRTAVILPDPQPLRGENKYPGSHDTYDGIELLLNQAIILRSAGTKFLRRSILDRFYEAPQFAGDDAPAGHYWSYAISDVTDERDFIDFRPPFLVTLSMDASQVVTVPRLPDTDVTAVLDRIRAYDLHCASIEPARAAETAAYITLLTEARVELTDPGLTRGAHQELVVVLGLAGLRYVTAPEFGNPDREDTRIDMRKLYKAIAVAKADRRLGVRQTIT